MAERAVTKSDGTTRRATSPWPALWALVVGFFMILVDATIVSVATPAIMRDLGADVASVVWVTSAYLLAFAVPLLVTGRLGDRYGPKQVYTTGLVIFTLASLWCGLTANVEQLIVARIVQGLGASLMNPQTMAVITRTFPADQRGRMFLLVFGIQEGQTFDWGTIVGPISVWSLIVAGLVVLAGFVFWQARNRGEPLLSLALFRDRNFSLANVAITTVGFSITSMTFPLMLYAQGVRGLTPTQAALLLAPMAVISGALAPLVGRLTDRHHPRYVAGFGLVCFPAALGWLAAVLVPSAPILQLLLPIALLGVGSAFLFAPIGSTATRNLPMSHAGSGAGVYNTTRQVGAVLGSAGVAAIMESRLAALLPRISGDAEAAQLPPALHGAFATAMAQSLLLPAAVLLIGLAAALCFTRPTHLRSDAAPAAATGN
jgi:MFS family permease